MTYWLRPDSLAAITILPAWAWLTLLFLILPFLRRRHFPLSLLPLTTWLAFLLIHVEEPKTFATGLFNPINETKLPNTLRLASMNCGGGLVAPLYELLDLQPDVVFLQEPPPQEDVEHFAKQLFGDDGHYICNADTCIIAKGHLTFSTNTPSLIYTHGTLELPDIGTLHLISLRLRTGSTRTDLWNPDAWAEHRAQRKLQRNQLQQIMSEAGTHDSMVIAGDFNAPQGDGIYSALRPHFFDTFHASGKGIGNTIINDLPILRIDQIWVSSDFTAHQSFSRKSMHSDHRFVISDIKR